MANRFSITWPDFGISVPLELCSDENPELCEAFWGNLPFKTVFAASMSAGEMFKIPIKFTLPMSPPEKNVLFTDQPPGTMLVLPMGALVLSYGRVAEPFMIPRLAWVPEPEVGILRQAAYRLIQGALEGVRAR